MSLKNERNIGSCQIGQEEWQADRHDYKLIHIYFRDKLRFVEELYYS